MGKVIICAEVNNYLYDQRCSVKPGKTILELTSHSMFGVGR